MQAYEFVQQPKEIQKNLFQQKAFGNCVLEL